MVVSSSSLRAYRSSGKAIPSVLLPSAPTQASGWPFAVILLPPTGVARVACRGKSSQSGGWCLPPGVDHLHRFDVHCHAQDQRCLDCWYSRLLFLTFLALTIGWLAGVGTGTFTTWIQIGGWLGIVTAIAAWYTALAGVLASLKFINLPTYQ